MPRSANARFQVAPLIKIGSSLSVNQLRSFQNGKREWQRRTRVIKGVTSMSRPIGVGIIGMGWMGEVHSRSYSQIPQRFLHCPLRPRLIICADDAEARSRAAQARFGFQKQTKDWKRVIEDPEVEV